MRLTTGTHFTPTHCSGQFLTLFSLIKVAGADPEKGGGGGGGGRRGVKPLTRRALCIET